MLKRGFGGPEAASLKNQAPKIATGGLTPQYTKRRLEGRPPKNPDRALRFSEKKISGPLKSGQGTSVFRKKILRPKRRGVTKKCSVTANLQNTSEKCRQPCNKPE